MNWMISKIVAVYGKDREKYNCLNKTGIISKDFQGTFYILKEQFKFTKLELYADCFFWNVTMVISNKLKET